MRRSGAGTLRLVVFGMSLAVAGCGSGAGAPADAPPAARSSAPGTPTAVATAVTTAPAGNADDVLGTWAVAGDCSRGPQLRVEADRLTLINGSDVASYGDVAWPASFFGPEYKGISRAAIPEVGTLDSPFTVLFNYDEQPGAMRIDIPHSADMPGNARYNAIQAAGRALVARFAFGENELLRCAVPPPAPAPTPGATR